MTKSMRSLAGWTLVAVAALPQVALACPVCFSAQNEENRLAFILTTAFLTLLPLGMLTLGLGWAWKRMRMQESAGSVVPASGSTATHGGDGV